MGHRSSMVNVSYLLLCTFIVIAVIIVSLLNVMVSVRPSNITTVITKTSTCCLKMDSYDVTILSTQMYTKPGGIDPTNKQPKLLLQLLSGKYNKTM